MEMSGQLHATASLPPECDPLVLIGQEAGSGRCNEKKFLTAGNLTQSFSHCHCTDWATPVLDFYSTFRKKS